MVRIQLSQKNRSQRVILNFKDVFNLSNRLSNLVSWTLLNNSDILYNNKNKTLYNVCSKEILAQAKKWNNRLLFQPLNLLDTAISLLKRLDKIYQ